MFLSGQLPRSAFLVLLDPSRIGREFSQPLQLSPFVQDASPAGRPEYNAIIRIAYRLCSAWQQGLFDELRRGKQTGILPGRGDHLYAQRQAVIIEQPRHVHRGSADHRPQTIEQRYAGRAQTKRRRTRGGRKNQRIASGHQGRKGGPGGFAQCPGSIELCIGHGGALLEPCQ